MNDNFESQFTGKRVDLAINKIPGNIPNQDCVIINDKDGANYKLLSDFDVRLDVDSALSSTSKNPVQNKVVTEVLNRKLQLPLSSITGYLRNKGFNNNEWVQVTSGPTGISAYQDWIASGHTGTQSDYLLSLIGPTGAKGIVGLKGEAGNIGLIGPTGDPGKNGTNGKPGEKGMVGPQGDPGPQGQPGKNKIGTMGATGVAGSKGKDGPPGVKGANGKTIISFTTHVTLNRNNRYDWLPTETYEPYIIVSYSDGTSQKIDIEEYQAPTTPTFAGGIYFSTDRNKYPTPSNYDYMMSLEAAGILRDGNLFISNIDSFQNLMSSMATNYRRAIMYPPEESSLLMDCLGGPAFSDVWTNLANNNLILGLDISQDICYYGRIEEKALEGFHPMEGYDNLKDIPILFFGLREGLSASMFVTIRKTQKGITIFGGWAYSMVASKIYGSTDYTLLTTWDKTPI